MRLAQGAKARIVLTDGTTAAGTVRRSWRWRTIRLERAELYDRTGPVVAQGYLLIPHRSILFVQVEED